MWWFWLWLLFVTVLLMLPIVSAFGRDGWPEHPLPTREARPMPEAVGNRYMGAALVWIAFGVGVGWLLLAFVWTM